MTDRFPRVNPAQQTGWAEAIQRIHDALQGVSGKGVPIRLTGLAETDTYALTVKNTGAGGKAIQVYSSTGTLLFQVDDDGIYPDIVSPWARNPSEGYLYPQTPTDEIVIGGNTFQSHGPLHVAGDTLRLATNKSPVNAGVTGGDSSGNSRPVALVNITTADLASAVTGDGRLAVQFAGAEFLDASSVFNGLSAGLGWSLVWVGTFTNSGFSAQYFFDSNSPRRIIAWAHSGSSASGIGWFNGSSWQSLTGDLTTAFDPTPAVWAVRFNWSDGRIRLSKNGVTIGTDALQFSSWTFGATTKIFAPWDATAGSPVGACHGRFSDVAYFDRFITDSELAAIAAQRTTGQYGPTILGTPGLYAYWPLTTPPTPAYSGELCADDNYFYRYCNGQWKRAAWSSY